jgi:uncharacterized protein (DUF3084 family)
MIDIKTLKTINTLMETADKIMSSKREFKARVKELSDWAERAESARDQAVQNSQQELAALAKNEKVLDQLLRKEASLNKKEQQIKKESDEIKKIREETKALESEVKLLHTNTTKEKREFETYCRNTKAAFDRKELELDTREKELAGREAAVAEKINRVAEAASL